MSAVPFDTHALVKRLQGAGFTVEQAEIIADIQRESGAAYAEQVKHDFHLDDIATKRDLDARIKETELKIELARADLGRDIEKAKSELVRWVVGVGILQTTLLTGVLLKMAHLI